jgi:cobalt/nickel transport system permease protein
VVVSSIALLIQALFLAHGGLSAWGANIVSMGIAGSFAAYLAFRGLQRLKLPLFFCGFIAGILADWATYTLTSLELSLALTTNKPLLSLFFTLLIAFAPTQIPLGILEGFLTGGLVVFVAKRRPDILTSLQIIKNKTKKSPAKIISLLLPFLLLTSPGLAEPESKWGGIDEIVIEKIAKERGRTPSHPLLNLEQGDLPLLCFFLAGLIGGIILTICYQKLFAKKNNHNFPKHSTKP